jgi:hypothetical protein
MDKFRKKNDILDPLSVIVKLFIYSYKPIGTKISIHSNKLYIQDPGLFQGTVRILFGDCKNDINIIMFPILYSCVKYLTKDSKVKFYNIFERVSISFDIMKETYNGHEIIYNIDQLKTIVSTFLSSNEDVNPSNLLSTYSSPGGLIKQGMYDHISSIWTPARLAVIFGIINEIFEASSNEVTQSLLASLSSYMQSVDMIAGNLISAI